MLYVVLTLVLVLAIVLVLVVGVRVVVGVGSIFDRVGVRSGGAVTRGGR